MAEKVNLMAWDDALDRVRQQVTEARECYQSLEQRANNALESLRAAESELRDLEAIDHDVRAAAARIAAAKGGV